MLWGLSGASGTGKTTLGTMIAESMNITFVKTSIKDMAKRNGYDAIGDLPLFQRLRLQEDLLSEMERLIISCPTPAILDRTPLDLIGYMMAEVSMHSGKLLKTDEMEQINDYVSRCQRMTDRYFDHVFVTGLLPEYEVAPTRPGYNPAYQRNVHLLINGALFTMTGGLHYSILTSSELNSRVEYVSDVIEKRLNDIEEQRATSKNLH